MYFNHMYNTLPECPVPCVNMITSFGYPNPNIDKLTSENSLVNEFWKNRGEVRIYFNKLVKVTEDFVSYDFLRLYNFLSSIMDLHLSKF